MVQSILVGFDPASVRNIGWCVINIEENEKTGQITSFKVNAGTIVFSDYDEPWQVSWPMFTAIDSFLDKQKPNCVIVEKTSSFRGGFVTGQVSNCLGVIQAACGKQGLPMSFVFPSHVKKIITGSGRASKAEIKKSVIKILANLSKSEEKDIPKFGSEHAYDAVANVLCKLLEKKYIAQLPKEED